MQDTRDDGSIPGSGRSLGGGHGNPLRYSCLVNPVDRICARGAWQATVCSIASDVEASAASCKILSITSACAAVAQSCPTLGDPVDCSPPGSSVHGTLQARVLEWGAISFSKYHVYLVHKLINKPCCIVTLKEWVEEGDIGGGGFY